MELRKKIEEAIGRVFSVAGWRSDPLERDCAAAALSAIEEAGFVVVPREPTGEMRSAGADEGNWSEHEDSIPRELVNEVVGGWAGDVYRAMINASPRR